jgi:uncharacterized protein (TIGR02246 family)
MRSRWLTLIAVLLLITIKEPAMAANPEVNDEARSEIAVLIAAEEAAWNQGSAEAFCDRALPDMHSPTSSACSRSAKRLSSPNMSASSRRSTRAAPNRIRIEHITLVKPDVAIVDTLTVVTGVQKAPPGVQLIDSALHTRLEQVLVRRADGWWIEAFHNVAVNPAVTSGPPPKP